MKRPRYTSCSESFPRIRTHKTVDRPLLLRRSLTHLEWRVDAPQSWRIRVQDLCAKLAAARWFPWRGLQQKQWTNSDLQPNASCLEVKLKLETNGLLRESLIIDALAFYIFLNKFSQLAWGYKVIKNIEKPILLVVHLSRISMPWFYNTVILCLLILRKNWLIFSVKHIAIYC